MRTIGVDLAAEPRATAVSTIEWSAGGARLSSLVLGADDDAIVRLTNGADKVGIDCALGWPVEFVSFLQRHADVDSPLEDVDGGLEARRRLAFRETDRRVREVTGRWPLSVATDRLGMTAFRCAGLLSRLHRAGIDIDRTGDGVVIEIYPGATLRVWGFDVAGYRNSPTIREQIVTEITTRAPWLEVEEFRPVLIESCDAFDSVIAALATRSAALGFYDRPLGDDRARAAVEGWIALPTRGIEALVSRPA